MYDLYIKAPVTVDGKETKDVEYYGKDFNKITVTFEYEYEMIDEAKMGNENLTVKYFDKDGKEVTLAPEGTKVAYAEVSYGTVVTDPIVITTTKQERANWCELKTGTYTYEALSQTIVVAGDKNSAAAERKITVNKAGGDITGKNLKDKLVAEALYCPFEKVEVLNTDATEAVTGELDSGMFVRVTSWDGSLSIDYQIVINAG